MDGVKEFVPVVSLIVALVSVIVGPLVSLKIAKSQIESSERLTNRQIISPIRQMWIDNLRQKMVYVLETSLRYYVSGCFEDIEMPDTEEETELLQKKMERKLSFLCTEIELMLNPDEEEHISLLKQLNDCWHSSMDREKVVEYPDIHKSTSALCKSVLKREWERVKSGE